MAIADRLKTLFDRNQARYDVVPFREAFTARESAQNARVSGRSFAKVLVMRDDAGRDFLLVLPASRQFDRHTVREVTGRPGMRLEDEAELQRLFPDCELGAMPPFGHLYGLAMWVDPCLAREPEIWFEAGTHHELIRMPWAEYDRLAQPFHMEECLHGRLVGAYEG